MTVFTFLLPCDNGAKVAIGLTVFLSLYVLQLAIAENIPEADSLPLISKSDLSNMNASQHCDARGRIEMRVKKSAILAHLE